MAYQIAFDMYESATQQFLARVLGEHSNLREKYRLEWKYRFWPGLEREDWRVGQENVSKSELFFRFISVLLTILPTAFFRVI
jgi:hypothetical protein